MTPKDIAALGAVRIREGRERRTHRSAYCVVGPALDRRFMYATTGGDRRSTVSPRAAELAAEIERLRGMLAALEENRDALLASGIAAGNVAGE